MQSLGIDIETYSPVKLDKAGVYKYSEALDFEILLFGYKVDHHDTVVIDLASGEQIPEEILQALTDEKVIKTAHNAPFEITCLQAYLGIELPVSQWQCTQVLCAYAGLPMALEKAAETLKLPVQKDKKGKALIRLFTQPQKPTKNNGFSKRCLPTHQPEKWQQFKAYNATDVDTEQAIRAKILRVVELPEKERRLWVLDQKINRAGIRVDWPFVHQAMKCDSITRERLTLECTAITGLANVNSVAQLKEWLNIEREDDESETEEITTLNKEKLPALIANASSETVKRVLEIRQEMSRTSIKKYARMLTGRCADDRLHGIVQFYGARTGRWAGRGTQLHNLRKNDLKDLDLARNLIAAGNFETAALLFGDTSDVISQLIRTAFIPEREKKFIISDFTSIEAVVIAWLADEKWRMDIFNKGGIDIYKASAAQMFKKRLEDITSADRQRGKVSELALGFGGSTGALERMGALKMGLLKEELKPIVFAWRAANPAIVKLWSAFETAAINAVKTGMKIPSVKGIVFYVKNNVLFIQLPSGRVLSYLRPKIVHNDYGSEQIAYEGVEQAKKAWGRQYTYGGKITENIVQAIARDILAEKMIMVDSAGYDIVLHVHDELVAEVMQWQTMDEIDKIMNTPVTWAQGLPVRAKTFESLFYKKD